MSGSLRCWNRRMFHLGLSSTIGLWLIVDSSLIRRIPPSYEIKPRYYSKWIQKTGSFGPIEIKDTITLLSESGKSKSHGIPGHVTASALPCLISSASRPRLISSASQTRLAIYPSQYRQMKPKSPRSAPTYLRLIATKTINPSPPPKVSSNRRTAPREFL